MKNFNLNFYTPEKVKSNFSKLIRYLYKSLRI